VHPAAARLLHRQVGLVAPVHPIRDALWLPTVSHYPFLAALPLQDQAKLLALAALFLRR